MNIDEDKAFEKWLELQPISPISPEAVWAEKAWLAAKAHAVEMAKPECVVFETMIGSWRVTRPNPGRGLVNTLFLCTQNGDTGKATATKWAIDNGYRVIEE